MPAFLNWLLRLLPTNPICMRLVQGGSRQFKHLSIRAGYLGVMIAVLLFALLGQSGAGQLSLRQLAGTGAVIFENVSYLQIGLICILTPIFMAGAIAQEANPRTWEILLTTPLNNLQIVLGNLFGRLFFVIALLFSSLPLFVMIQYFGGVPGESIFVSYALAGSSALLVAAIAVTLSVTRTAGRRAVFIFYAVVFMYLFVTAGADVVFSKAVPNAVDQRYTTVFTAINPFLALRSLLNSNAYLAHDFTGATATWIERAFFGQPTATYCWLCVIISSTLMLFSTFRLRVIGARVGAIPWYRRLLRLGAQNATERPARAVGKNPISWRESVLRGKTVVGIVGRWGFLIVGLIAAIIVLTLYHTGGLDHQTMRLTLLTILSAEIAIIAFAALNMSATAVSREREDGSLDIILTTPIQPGPYIAGKHRGLLQYLVPMLLLPVTTIMLTALYVVFDGFGREGGVMMSETARSTASKIQVPVILPELALALPLTLIPFIAFCVMVGLHWSIRSKGTISSMVAAASVVIVATGVLSLCGRVSGEGMSVLGAVMNALSPINILFAGIVPTSTIPGSLGDANLGAARTSLVVGSGIAAAGYIFVAVLLHQNMKRTFMMTVRRLAGTS